MVWLGKSYQIFYKLYFADFTWSILEYLDPYIIVLTRVNCDVMCNSSLEISKSLFQKPLKVMKLPSFWYHLVHAE